MECSGCWLLAEGQPASCGPDLCPPVTRSADFPLIKVSGRIADFWSLQERHISETGDVLSHSMKMGIGCLEMWPPGVPGREDAPLAVFACRHGVNVPFMVVFKPPTDVPKHRGRDTESQELAGTLHWGLRSGRVHLGSKLSRDSVCPACLTPLPHPDPQFIPPAPDLGHLSCMASSPRDGGARHAVVEVGSHRRSSHSLSLGGRPLVLFRAPQAAAGAGAALKSPAWQ